MTFNTCYIIEERYNVLSLTIENYWGNLICQCVKYRKYQIFGIFWSVKYSWTIFRPDISRMLKPSGRTFVQRLKKFQ